MGVQTTMRNSVIPGLALTVLILSILSGCKDDAAAVKAAEEKEVAKAKAQKEEEAKVRALPLPMSPVTSSESFRRSHLEWLFSRGVPRPR